jgi:hypothetical protein
MSGGTLTPPRDPRWGSEELIAPVIPFRQREQEAQQQIRVERTPDAPIVAAPADHSPSSWIHQGSDLLAHENAATQLVVESDAPRSLRPRHLLIAGFVAAALVVGVGAALALSHDHQPGAQLSAHRQTTPSTRTGHVAASRDDHRPAASKQAGHTTTKHASQGTDRSRAHKTPKAPTPASLRVAAATSLQPASTQASALNPCVEAVPGQLGC